MWKGECVLRAIRPRLTFANVVAMLALFIALSGGVYAIAKHKKKRKPVDTVAAAVISDTGVVVNSTPGVTVAKGAAGAYCVHLPFTPHAAVANVINAVSGQFNIYTDVPPVVADACPAGSSVFVGVFKAPSATPTNAPFNILAH
jgi:hypothetical protein